MVQKKIKHSKNLMLKAVFLVSLITLSSIPFVAEANLVENGDFSDRLTGWSSTGVQVFNSGLADSGNVAKLDTTYGVGLEFLWQELSIPYETTQLQVSFDYLFTGKNKSWRRDDYAGATLGYYIEDTFFSLCDNDAWNIEVLMFEASSESLVTDVVSFSTTIDITGIADLDPNAEIVFSLFESWPSRTNTALFVDNVTVNSVPIPSALFLLSSCFIGLGS